jgi:hypothetical protein
MQLSAEIQRIYFATNAPRNKRTQRKINEQGKEEERKYSGRKREKQKERLYIGRRYIQRMKRKLK